MVYRTICIAAKGAVGTEGSIDAITAVLAYSVYITDAVLRTYAILLTGCIHDSLFPQAVMAGVRICHIRRGACEKDCCSH